MAQIQRTPAINLASDFCTRMRSIGKTPAEIAKLVFYLRVSIDNVNDLDKLAKQQAS